MRDAVLILLAYRLTRKKLGKFLVKVDEILRVLSPFGFVLKGGDCFMLL